MVRSMTDKTDLAEDRTDWAEDRTILASERTFAGWMRTGMTAVAIALGLQAVFREFQPTWVPKAAATAFVAIAVFVFVTAAIEARKTLRRMAPHAARPRSPASTWAIALALSLAALATGAILWAL
jgi:putative membrane protein